MAITIPSSISVATNKAIDERFVFTTTAEREALDNSFRYLGLLSYDEEQEKYYYLKNDINTWEEFKMSNTNVSSFIVGVGGLSPFKLVYLNKLNTVITADSSNQTHFNRVIGFTNKAYFENDNIIPIVDGEIINSSWNLIVGSTYFLGSGGDITNIAPSTGFIQQVGIAKNATTLIVKIGTPIKIL